MSLLRFLPTFLGFPLGGLLAIETVGSLDGPLAAALGGLLAGGVLGAAQWLALRGSGISVRWIGHTAVAMGGGAALAAVVVGTGTAPADLALHGLVTGAVVGLAQAPLLAGGRRLAATWTAVTGVAWALGWLVTSAVIVDAERGHHAFGASGAIVATLITGLALHAMRGTRAGRPALAPATLGA